MYRLGLIAKDIHNSVSPMIYETLMASIGEESTYEIQNVPENMLEQTVEYARKNWNGFNVTMPYKQAILPYMDEIDESAEKCGSTNTVLVKNGKLIAYNTDGVGLIKAMQRVGFDFKDKRIVMVGAGGVAFSIAYNLSIHGVTRVDVVNLFEEQTANLCKKFGDRFIPHPLDYDVLAECCQNADLFINASVIGQIGYDEFARFDFLDQLKPEAPVFDVNYSNPNAKLLPSAKGKGHPAYIGSNMTVCQAVRVMQIWTGKEPSDKAISDLMKKIMTGGK
jgi:shikimate dehydrogenase